jgi:hypothetical protein
MKPKNISKIEKKLREFDKKYNVNVDWKKIYSRLEKNRIKKN